MSSDEKHVNNSGKICESISMDREACDGESGDGTSTLLSLSQQSSNSKPIVATRELKRTVTSTPVRDAEHNKLSHSDGESRKAQVR